MQVSNVVKQLKVSGALTGAIVAGSILAFTANPIFAASATTVHSATAYGAEVNVGTVVKLGKIAFAELPSCDTQNVGSFTATAASVSRLRFGEHGACRLRRLKHSRLFYGIE